MPRTCPVDPGLSERVLRVAGVREPRLLDVLVGEAMLLFAVLRVTVWRMTGVREAVLLGVS